MSKYLSTRPKEAFCKGDWKGWSMSVTDILTDKISGKQYGATIGYEVIDDKVTKRYWLITSTDEVVDFDNVEYIS